ncbi:hypothetical protein HW571_22605 [Agrobacterium genomosp. 3]|uniref:hypothetical protein n=1 Tax=Agrobacterium tomkonis TaxID=1183410 RepID=UPI001CD82EEE|nr:hypothetical protein [Agrobacterium tomkonis]MCA1878886.1 hypothetical protein [Agrobacterium tumefaciens]MCA1894121.1 hypothetical protein [Agrobacterium tomkonis]
MSRFTITLVHGSAEDTEAVIGFDPPLQTYFLQGFPFEMQDCAYWKIWLGTDFREYPEIEDLVKAVRAKGYDFHGLSEPQMEQMLEEAQRPVVLRPGLRFVMRERNDEVR